jgi:inhibitor of KinA sporulation pathway (predicted exonuclease)
MNYIIIDLEATCSQNRSFQSEIIEFGAVYLNKNLAVIDEFQSFVKPVINPILTSFCKSLTGIKQEDVDEACKFHEVFADFVGWCGTDSAFIFASYGFYDKNQLKKDCAYHRVEYPQILKNHVSVKHLFANHRNNKLCGMFEALQLLELPLEGQHHRALDDAKNIVKIWRSLF